MIDWEDRVRELLRIVNEMEMLAQQLEGRPRMMLGRSADELKRFAADITRELRHEAAQQTDASMPEWLAQQVDPEAVEQSWEQHAAPAGDSADEDTAR